MEWEEMVKGSVRIYRCVIEGIYWIDKEFSSILMREKSKIMKTTNASTNLGT
jgi:hypothetical protein